MSVEKVRKKVGIGNTPNAFASGAYTNISEVGNQLYSATSNIANSVNNIGNVTNAVQEAVVADQARQSSAKMSDIYNKFMANHNQFMNESIYNQKGHNATNAVTDTDKFFTDQTNSLLGDLNPQEQQILTAKITAQRTSSIGNAFNHKNSQLEKAIIDDHSALITLHSQNAVNDVANKTSHLNNMNESLISIAQRQGWGENQLALEQQKMIDKVHSSIISNSINRGDLLGASAQLKEYQKVLTPQNFQALQNIVNQRQKMVQIQYDTDLSINNIVVNGGDYMQNSDETFIGEIAKIRKNYSGIEEEERVNYLKKRNSEAKRHSTMQFARDIKENMFKLRRAKTVSEQQAIIKTLPNETLKGEVTQRFNKLNSSHKTVMKDAELVNTLYYAKRDLDRGYTIFKGEKMPLQGENDFNTFFEMLGVEYKHYDILKARYSKKGDHITNDMRMEALKGNGITEDMAVRNPELDKMLDSYLEGRFGIDEKHSPEKIKQYTADFLVREVTDKDLVYHDNIQVQDAFKDSGYDLSFSKEQVQNFIKTERINDLVLDQRISRARATQEVEDDVITVEDINDYLARYKITDKYLGE